MSNTYGVNGSAPLSYPTGYDTGMTTLSADSLLAYCQLQLGDLDGQINDQMTQQKTALREREAVESAQNVLGGYGTAGPQDPDSMQKCVDALDNAMAQLPTADPVRAQLDAFKTKMIGDYDYQAAQQLSGPEQTQLAQAQTAASAPIGYVNQGPPGQAAVADTSSQVTATNTVNLLETKQNGTFTKPNPDQKQWEGTTQALSTISDDIKSNAEIQLLQLQDLVSQRQQAIQLCSGMMSKTDQTLEDQAKAIGH